MSITYEEALATLNSMFGAPWENSHLDAVLRHFQGHMENTVESILNHGDKPPEDLITQLKSKPTTQTDPSSGGGTGLDAVQISMDEELARALASEEDRSAAVQESPSHNNNAPTVNRSQIMSGGVAPTPRPQKKTKPVAPVVPTKKGRGTPTDLPPDFLRIPGKKYNDGVAGDEALARMLQDDLFTEELANNPEFAHLARGRNPSAASRYSRQPRASNAVYAGYTPGGGGGGGVDIMKAMSEMGETAKKRLALFAANWNAKQGGGNNGGAMSERRGLLDNPTENEQEMLSTGEGMEMRPISQQQNQNSGMGWATSKKNK
mmetsp:Transcript_638/g.855  ORF Transcript_638/g.855 Transcript_638/m.855 type:complete len:319 (+) Transcript_638:261-1217(+)|eukprot:CAMPEP_0172496248 /NCGR_PEP_ID=MMETSP1066-20121228/84001_1 /TAXON_ID=671091 /ORGANISM="Coscinodiscus wailesii, Strain CCMP2513" /LENGTH=318 /DNA_ID=CAMNT_0013268439 /DNA_START=259 /DNA_END=1215 /DNA_ORIENTATION=+